MLISTTRRQVAGKETETEMETAFPSLADYGVVVVRYSFAGQVRTTGAKTIRQCTHRSCGTRPLSSSSTHTPTSPIPGVRSPGSVLSITPLLFVSDAPSSRDVVGSGVTPSLPTNLDGTVEYSGERCQGVEPYAAGADA